MLQVEPLLDQSLALVSSPTVDIRIAMIPAIATRANKYNDPKEIAAFERLKNDPSSDVKDAINRFLNGGMSESEAMILGIDVEQRPTIETQSDPEPSAHEPVSQTPKWSKFRK